VSILENITQEVYLGQKMLSESKKGNFTFIHTTLINYIVYKAFSAISS